MKNLFKNLMLVAVAAMAFTACQNDNSEIDTLAKTRVVTFTANIGEDTRSGFTGKVDNVYKSAWDGGEMLFVKAENTEKWPTISADGTFQVEFKAGDSFVSIYSPVASWENNTSYNAYMPVVPIEQTPRANSVDPAAHILSAQNVPIGETGEVAVSMQHQVAYGKMTVNTPAEFEITQVVLNLKGAYYGVDKDLTYTLVNDGAIENNTFWFATEPLKVSEFTITAHGSDGKKMAKTVAVAEDKLNFNYGCVSTFSVGNLTEQEAPDTVMDSATYYYNYDDIGAYPDWGYLVFEDANLGTLILNTTFKQGLYLNLGNYLGGNYTQGFDNGMSYYFPVGESRGYYKALTQSTMTVSVVDGKYRLAFDIKNRNGETLIATYVGDIEGLGYPDLRAYLAMPQVTSSISGKTITLSWGAVDKAESYLVESYFMDPISTTETTITIDVPNYETREFTVQAVVGDDNANYRSSDKAYVYYNDPRLQLTTPNVVATVDGSSVTISWDPVENAAKYEVSYYLNGSQTVMIEETSYTFEAGYNVSNLYVYVTAIANENDENYRSSAEEYVVVSTGKDPNILADFVYDTLSWNSSYSRFELTGGGNDVTQFYVNSADRPNNNSIKAGHYTYAGNTVSDPAQGKFSLRLILGSGSGSSHRVNDAVMDVSVVNGEYNIIITIVSAGNANIVGKTFGYKGLPSDFELPSEGGNETPGGDDNEPTINLDGYTKCNLESIEEGLYLGTYYDFIAKINLWDATTYDEVSISLSAMGSGTSVEGKTIATGDYTFESNTNNYTFKMQAYDFYCFGSNYSASTTGTVKVYNNNGTYTILLDLSVNGTPIKYYYQGTL